MDARHDDIFRYVFSVEDRDGLWRYEHEQESVWCAPVVDLAHALKDLLLYDPEAFPVKVYRHDTETYDFHAELVATVSSRRDILEIAARHRVPRANRRGPFSALKSERARIAKQRREAARVRYDKLVARVEQLVAEKDRIGAALPSSDLVERIADTKPRFLPMPPGVQPADSSTLTQAGSFWIGPVHSDGSLWWCEIAKRSDAPYKWKDALAGDRALRVGAAGVVAQAAPQEVIAHCMAYTSAGKRAVPEPEAFAAADASRFYLSLPNPAEFAKLREKRERLSSEIAEARTRIAEAAEKLTFLTEYDYWDIPDWSGPAPVAPLSGRDPIPAQDETDASEFDQDDMPDIEERYWTTIYRHREFERYRGKGTISRKWTECDDHDNFYKMRFGRAFLIVSVRKTSRVEALEPHEEAYSLHEVTIEGGLFRGEEALAVYVGPALKRARVGGIDLDLFCHHVVRYIAKRSVGLVRNALVRRMDVLRSRHAEAWKARRAETPDPMANKIIKRIAEDRPTALDVPGYLVQPARRNVDYDVFTKASGRVICDPVFWNGVLWMVRGKKPAGERLKSTNVVAEETALMIGPDGISETALPAELSELLPSTGYLARRALDPSVEAEVAEWARGRFPTIVDRLAMAAERRPSDGGREIAALAARIRRLEKRIAAYPRPGGLADHFGDVLRHWGIERLYNAAADPVDGA